MSVKATVIVTTYNSPGTLESVFFALARQSRLPDMVVVADDGSSSDTSLLIEKISDRLPFPLIHTWQPDDGFRLARSRNNAIHVALDGLVAMIDQDILPSRDWLKTHLEFVSPGCLGIGNTIDLPPESKITPKDVTNGFYELSPPDAQLKKLKKLQRRNAFYALLRKFGIGIKNKPKLRGNNMSAYLSDLIEVNGFDEEYVGWGQEDDDLGRRLYMNGIKPVVLVDKALAFHIWHPTRKSGRWRDGANVARFKRGVTNARCVKGLDNARPDVVIRRFKLAD